MDPLTIVEQVDVLGNSPAGLRPGGEDGAIASSFFKAAKDDSAIALMLLSLTVSAHAAPSRRTGYVVPLRVVRELQTGTRVLRVGAHAQL